MRIAVFHNLPSGGAKRAVHEWVRRLADTHELDVFSLSSADHDYCDLRPYARSYRTVAYAPRKLFRRPFGRLNHLQRLLDLSTLTKLSSQLAAEIDGAGYDVIFANPCQYTFVPVLVQFVRTPVVYFLHEPFGPGFTRPIDRQYTQNTRKHKTPGQPGLLATIYERRLWRLQLSSLRRVTLLLANSKFTQEVMLSAYDIRSQVCPLGVNTTEFRPLAGIFKDTSVISVGELAPRKGFDFVIQSLALIPENRRPDLRIAYNAEILGERQYLEETAERCGVKVHFCGHLNTDQLVTEYNRAAVCAYAPILEPLGLVALEAMACGTPVVGVSEGGIAETVITDHTGLLVTRDPKVYAQAIQALLEDPTLCNRYGEQARQHVTQNWSWERSVASLERFLNLAADSAMSYSF